MSSIQQTARASINSRFLEEARQIEKRWAKHKPTFIGSDRKWERAATAALLESQRLINERTNPTPRLEDFKMLRIPLGRRGRRPARFDDPTYGGPAWNEPLTKWKKEKEEVNWLKEGF
jgi:hypothetical protein